MTDQERLDRQSLLKKAAAISGAVYFAPVLTSAASAGTDKKLCKGKCKDATKQAKCRARGGGGKCDCNIGEKCMPAQSGCAPNDPRCPQSTACAGLATCNSGGTCACFLLWNQGGSGVGECVAFPSNFCSDYQPCSRSDGSGCPPGSCCLDTCCPDGICSPPCSSGAAPRISRTSGSGATLTTS